MLDGKRYCVQKMKYFHVKGDGKCILLKWDLSYSNHKCL